MRFLPNKPVEISTELKKQADFILKEIKFYEILSSCKRIIPTGSYFLDLMAYPDVDFYVSKVDIAQIFKIAGKFAKSVLVFEIKFEKSKDPRLSEGFYLKLWINYGNWKRPWKIDMWFLEDSTIDKIMSEMYNFKNKLTSRLKEQILNYKFSIINNEHRTPMYSGYFIYKAFIDEAMTDFHAVTEYLIKNEIKINQK